MGLKNLLNSLLGSSSGSGSNASSSATAAEPLEYNGYTIVAAPLNQGGQYRTAGSISKVIDGEQCEVGFVRADSSGSQDSAVEHSVYKAKQIIDEQGDSIFKREHV